MPNFGFSQHLYTEFFNRSSQSRHSPGGRFLAFFRRNGVQLTTGTQLTNGWCIALSREEKKRQTRQSLIEAALMLVGRGENFTGISIREVAKNAGVVPTSFYRHFSDMEALGLEIVDDIGMMLRKKLRLVRRQSEHYNGTLTRRSVELFSYFVCEHRNHFYFLYQCRAGGTPRLRTAIRNELSFFSNELATDVRQLNRLETISSNDLLMISEFIVTSVFDSTTDLLDLVDSSPNYSLEFNERTARKLRLIWLGAESWRSDLGRHAAPQSTRTANTSEQSLDDLAGATTMPVRHADIIG